MNKEQKDALFEGLTASLEKRDAIFGLDGPQMVIVKLNDGTFRKKTIGAVEFYLAKIYAGAKDMIFVFGFNDLEKDHESYSCIEIPAKDMDDVFPMFLSSMIEWVRGEFVPIDASRLIPINAADTVTELVSMCINFSNDDSKITVTDANNELASLPNFGMF